jgi:hypothetical protein
LATQLWQPEQASTLAHSLTPLVSLTLYLCSATAEFRERRGSPRQPGRPTPQRTKKGPRLFPPPGPSTWEVSYRLGAALRRAQQEADTAEAHAAAQAEPSAPRARPRPHIRRAHWHSYWVGSRRDASQRRVLVKWLPPIPVGLAEVDELIPTIHPVE